VKEMVKILVTLQEESNCNDHFKMHMQIYNALISTNINTNVNAKSDEDLIS
jgi:hypothetical protein